MQIDNRYKSPNITKGRNGYVPDIIVCHISEGYYESGCSWLCNPAAQASTHFFVSKKGEIAQLVDIKDTAWGNGTTTTAGDSRYCGNSALQSVRERKTSANNYTISIEHEGFYRDAHGALTAAQTAATIELIKYIKDEVKRIYGANMALDKQHIVGHCDIAPKWKPNCPGQRYPYDEIINKVNASTQVYKISETNLTAMVSAGVMASPDYWRSQSVQYLNELMTNAAKAGVLDKRIDNGIKDIDIALGVLVDAGVIASPDYWLNLIKANKVNYLKEVLVNIANKCRIILEKIVNAEAHGEGLTGQEYVANVVFNRVKDKGFPTGIYDVVYQNTVNNGKTTYQFSPIGDGAYNRAVPSTTVKSAVSNVLNGKDVSKGALFFCTKASASKPGNWHEKALTFLFEHGGHRFYK